MFNPILFKVLFEIDVGGIYRGNVIGMILHAGPVVKLVLLVLLIFSVISWGIIASKIILLRRTRQEAEEFFNLYYESKRLSSIYSESKEMNQNPFAVIFRAIYMELNRSLQSRTNPTRATSEREPNVLSTELTGMENIERVLKQAATSELNRYERALSFLATTGSTAPFIGLFGTVWGIMDAFRSIGIRGSASLAVVAPGIAEALVATAFGLFAAIPAVVFFNYFVNRIKVIASEMDNFSSELLNIIQRQFRT